MIYLKNPTNAEAIDPTTAAGSTLAANPYLDDQLCWERFANLTLTPGAGPCGSNGQSGQLLTDSTAFTATTMTQTAGVNGSDALPFKWVRITAKQNLMGALGTSGTKVASAPANDQQVCWDGIARGSSSRDVCYSVADRYAGLGNHLTGSYAQGGRESRIETHGADGSGLESAAHSAGPDFGYGARELAGKLHTECLRQLQMQLYHHGKR